MGNNVGKTIGTVAGVGCLLIPGVGPLAGAAILAGTTAIGSGADAIAENNRQRAENERIAREAQEANERRIREEQERAQREQAERERQIRYAQTQMDLVNRILDACRRGDVNQVRNDIWQLDDNYFNNTLGQQPIAVCTNPDVREQIQEILIDDQERRQLSFDPASRPRMG